MECRKISPKYSEVLLPDRETIHPRAKYSAFSSMCDCPNKYIKFTKWPCVLNCCSKCHSVLVPDAKVNDDEDVDLPFFFITMKI